MRIKCILACFLTLLLLALSMLDQETQAAQARGETAVVLINGSSTPPGFSPALLTVHVNATIVFINRAAPGISYMVSASDGSFTSPAIAPGQRWQTILTRVGVYEYHDPHMPQRMAGQIMVVASSISLLPTAQPGLRATAAALISADHAPPDNLASSRLTPVPTSRHTTKNTVVSVPWLLIAEITILLFGLAAALGLTVVVLRLLRKRYDQEGTDEDEEIDEDEEDEDDEKTLVSSTLAFFRSRRNDSEDDLDDE